MFGVVLWSDRQDQKAVIWCEDHGDLAFYRQSDSVDAVPLDAGDWVQFDLQVDRDVRRVYNPRLICEGLYPEIADLLATQPAPGGQTAPQPLHTAGAEVIPFTPRRRPGSDPVESPRIAQGG
jgi:hypothetical protein